jgi:hypothetical protein|tara:strand:+ start:72 stop:227 length:156 start_codon:yes stop_codon:yes gene_type:complete
MFKSEPASAYLSRKGKVVLLPQLSDVDKEWLEMEKQQKIIREQTKLILEKE